MPNHPVFTGQHPDFLAQKGPEYAKAREDGTHKDVVASVQRQFFLRWPIGSEEVNLTEDQLKSIDNDAPLPERPHPKERKDDFKTDKEYKDAEKAWQQYNKDVSMRKREHAPAMNEGDKHPFTPLLDQLSYGKKHAQKGKPRKQAVEEAWAEDNKSYFNAIREKHKKEEASKPSGLPAPAIQNSVLRKEFGKLSEEEQKEWEDRTQKKHAEALKEWTERKKKQNEKPSEKPEDLQACIDRLNEFCMPILDGIAERTGWCCSLLLGGPEPRDGGRLNMVALHAGKPTSGPVKMQFGRSEVQAWRSGIFLAFSRHLKKVYTMEECRARALPSDYKPDEGIQADGEEVLRWREPDIDVQAQPSEANEKEKEGQSKEGNVEVEKSKSKSDRPVKGGSNASKTPGSGKGKAKGSSRKKCQDGKSSEAVDEEPVGDEDEDNEDDNEDKNDVSNIVVTRSSPPCT
ncbi:SERTA domain-containing protein 3 [Marasmius crinis-equi]|uniref:SERTA domain-containing protein 3 n=1 Tax=Marasmius crinis-equi TaxID=585013 RepID=A0ABR3F735_9AGAR